jgi:pimeloyl-ACP methyl ester carboxylesterase/ribosomal protein S18 acetylase RimI-like enzyme
MSDARSALLPAPGATLYYEVRGSGPLLLMLQGGDGDANGAAGLVEQLASHFTVVTYDRRGLSRSRLDPGSPPPTIETHADDVHRLLEAVAREPALVFGVSIGALIGLEVVGRHPDKVRVLVAHEPPATQFLPESEQVIAARSQLGVEEAFRGEGTAAAMRAFAAIAGFDPGDREADASLPAPSPQRVINLEFFLTHDAPAVRLHRLDVELLRAASTRIVVGVGETSGRHLAGRCAMAMAHALGRAPVELPGGHNGFLMRPRAFAARLREILDVPAIRYEWRGAFGNAEVNALHAESFEHPTLQDDWWAQVNRHSLGWVCAREGPALAGFVNVAWDGAVHAFLVDTMVATSMRRRGVGRHLVGVAVEKARAAGCEWLHVDFDDPLGPFYFESCGFKRTTAGLIALARR